MKIIKAGMLSTWEPSDPNILCIQCMAQLQYERKDIRVRHHNGYDQREPEYDDIFVICPQCDYEIEIKGVPNVIIDDLRRP